MAIFYLMLAIVSGFCMAFQSPTNATLSRHIGNLQATTVSFGGGLICLTVLMFIIGSGDLTQVVNAEWWQLMGGVYGVCIVLAITYSIPRLGAALTSTIIMLGQITMGIILDTFGLLKLEAMPLAAGRIIGCIVVLAGIILVYQGKRKNEKSRTLNKGDIVVAVCTFVSGLIGALQAPTNTALAIHIGKLEASFMSFATGFIFILVIALIASKGHLLKGRQKGVEWWMTIGGTYGAAVVFINIVATPHLGVAALLITTMLGQLSAGTLVDSYGLMRAYKIRMNGWRYTGLAVIAVGVIITAIANM